MARYPGLARGVLYAIETEAYYHAIGTYSNSRYRTVNRVSQFETNTVTVAPYKQQDGDLKNFSRSWSGR